MEVYASYNRSSINLLIYLSYMNRHIHTYMNTYYFLSILFYSFLFCCCFLFLFFFSFFFCFLFFVLFSFTTLKIVKLRIIETSRNTMPRIRNLISSAAAPATTWNSLNQPHHHYYNPLPSLLPPLLIPFRPPLSDTPNHDQDYDDNHDC